MSQYQKRKIEEQYQKLPDTLKDALLGVDTANKIFEIGRKSLLTIEKVGFLAEEAGYVILGLTRPEDFVNILAERLETSTNDAREIAKEINSQIFYPLREALKTAHHIEVSEPATYDKRLTTTTEPLAAVAIKPASPPKIEMSPMPAMPRPAPPQPKIETTPPPRPSMSPPPAPTPYAIQKPQFIPVKPPPTSTPPKEFFTPAEPPKPPEPIKQPVAQPPPSLKAVEGKAKIPPIDLRRSTPPPHKAPAFDKSLAGKSLGKPERMREAIFAPPVEPQEAATAKEAPPAVKQPAMEPKQTEKKTPYGGYDPYKESVE